MTNAAPIPDSGDQNIDILTVSSKWDATSVTFGIPTTAAEYGDYAYSYPKNGETLEADETVGFVAPDPAFIQAVRDAMAAISSYTLLDLVEAASPGDAVIRAGITTTPKPSSASAGAYAVGPKDEDDPLYHIAGDAWFDPGGAAVLGTFRYTTVLHEMAHTVGLDDVNLNKGGTVKKVMEPEYRSSEYSIMSYTAYIGDTTNGWDGPTGHAPQTHMMWDIAALQHIYGANFTTNADNTIYRFSPTTGEMFIDGVSQGAPSQNIIFRTVWDGGGTDGYDFSLYGATFDMDIDLGAGGYIDVDRDTHLQAAELGGGPNEGHARGQIFNALLFEGDERSLIENVICGAGDDSVTGNQANNFLVGNAGSDSLFGMDGNDTLLSGEGGGILFGGDGQDLLIAGEGAEILVGGSGTDELTYLLSASGVIVNLELGTGALGWAQGDTIDGVEHVMGSSYDDILIGNDNANTLEGQDGNDGLFGDGGVDALSGGNGNDTLVGGTGGDWLVGGADTDTARFATSVSLNLATGVHTGEATGDIFTSIERFEGSQFDDTMSGNGGANWFAGRNGDDSLNGGTGNDTLNGGAGFDIIDGGTGTDLLDYSAESAAVNVNLFAGLAIGLSIDADTFTSMEEASGSAFDDALNGSNANNRLWGNDGNDLLNGGVGADSLYGGNGSDTLIGGVGDVLNGGGGYDVLRFYGAPVLVNLATGLHSHAQSIVQIERIEGTTGGDILAAGSTAMTLAGQDGDDTLIGGNKRDTLLGGEGRDSLEGLGGADLLRGGAGTDTIVGGSGGDVFRWETGDLGTDLITGFNLAEDRFSFGQGFLGSPVFGGGSLSDSLEAVTVLGFTVVRGFTAEAGWQDLARLEDVSVRALSEMIADGSILAPIEGLSLEVFA
jgi:serralysin